jgi:hypothetical protein
MILEKGAQLGHRPDRDATTADLDDMLNLAPSVDQHAGGIQTGADKIKPAPVARQTIYKNYVWIFPKCFLKKSGFGVICVRIYMDCNLAFARSDGADDLPHTVQMGMCQYYDTNGHFRTLKSNFPMT